MHIWLDCMLGSSRSTVWLHNICKWVWVVSPPMSSI
jgi:hypothetical protein